MQTFIPIATTNFSEIAKTLDNKRLNKQALEGWQILMTLTELDPEGNDRIPKGWANHPAVKMWRGYETALLHYIIAMCDEWRSRGFHTTIDDKARTTFTTAVMKGKISTKLVYPPCIVEEVATTHRTALLSKHYEWYSQFQWAEDTGSQPPTYEYLWVIENKENN
jgi:hypothetical protein